MFQRGAPDVVALAQGAVRLNQELGHDEERDALHPRRRVRRARQHQVDDVLGQVVLAVGDEDLLAGQPVAAVVLLHGARRHLRQIRAGLRLGEVHRARPFATDQVGHVLLALRVRADRQDGFDHAVGQHRTQRERQAGRLDVLARSGRHQFGQPLPAPYRRMLQALPAACRVVLETLRIPRRGANLTVLPDGRLRIARHVQRRDRLLDEAAVFFQDGIHQVWRHLFEAGQFQDVIESGQFLQGEAEVLQWGCVGHGVSINWRYLGFLWPILNPCLPLCGRMRQTLPATRTASLPRSPPPCLAAHRQARALHCWP
ncbi:hypothetical protein D9M68_472700 [compost metagenome]